MLFISHSTKDKAAALELQQRLLQRGYESSQLFLDSDAESGIAAGSKWEQVLYNRLKDCRALIALCSANWQQSKWCFAELIYAKAMGKEVFPILLEACDLGDVAGEFQGLSVYQEGEAAYQRLWAALESRHLSPREDFGWDGDECPFPGLMAFDEKYAGVYFGRAPETQAVLEELRKMRNNGEPRLLMIVGGSGSGKSSLLRAGVLPRVKHKAADSDWLVLPILRYGEAPNDDYTIFDQLARDLVALFPADARNVPDWKIVRDRFAGEDTEQAARGFNEITQDLTLARGCRDATVLLVIDQFEELLALAAGTVANRFMEFLHCIFSRRNGRLLAIGTIRSDYVDVYERHPHALMAPFFGPWRLGPFPRERLSDVIVKPAARAHVKFADDLLERLKQDTPTSEALPLLAFTLEKLYRRHAGEKLLELQEYLDLGGMEGAIQKSVDRIIPPGSLSPAKTAALRLSFVKHLAQVNDKDEIVRLTARWSDLPAPALAVLGQFVKERLLVKSEREQVEIAHEAMFRCWKTLSDWLRTSADILRWRRDVRRDRAGNKTWSGLSRAQLAVARRWPKQRREELSPEEVSWIASGIFRERLWRAVIAAVILLVSSLAGYAFIQKEVAETATWEAKAQAKISDSRRIAALSESERDKRLDRALLLAVEALNVNPTFEARNALFRALSIRPELNSIWHEDRFNRIVVAVNSGGRTIAAEYGGGGVVVWDVAARQRLADDPLVVNEGEVFTVAFSPDGKTMAAAYRALDDSGDDGVVLGDVATGKPKPMGEHSFVVKKGGVSSLVFSPDGKTLAAGYEARGGGGVVLWDVATGKPMGDKQITLRKGGVSSVAFSPDGKTIAAGYYEYRRGGGVVL